MIMETITKTLNQSSEKKELKEDIKVKDQRLHNILTKRNTNLMKK
jgi:hypothetical protein